MDKDGSTDEIAIDETRLLQDGKKKVTFVTDRQPEKKPEGSIGNKRQNDDGEFSQHRGNDVCQRRQERAMITSEHIHKNQL